ncbi:MAG: FkbM family methyltransferase [Candidatus Bathyarchaeota archaeon]|nr:FkbM family methyltransferase [Candidatus Termiticorpusculum sp.]
MLKTIIKNLYRKIIPFTVREKIGQIRHRNEINFSKIRLKQQETYFKSHIDDFKFDNVRKKEILRNFSLLRKNGITSFPEMDASIQEKYVTRKLKIEKDTTTGLFYVLIDNKKLFYKRSMDENTVRQAFNSVSLEQDYASPHRYLTSNNYFIGVIKSDTKGNLRKPHFRKLSNIATLFSTCDFWENIGFRRSHKKVKGENFGVSEGGIVIDVGAAEGNFALSVVEKASKVYIIEGDAEWCEALKQTFLPYKEKVVIIQKYLSNISNEDTITLVNLVEKYGLSEIDFLKMDIEGCEIQALWGGIIDNAQFVDINKMAICVYHNPSDEVEISQFVLRFKYNFCLTNGYMVFLDSHDSPLRKSVLRAYR